MKTCTNCGKKHYARGLCQTCYARVRRGIPLDAPQKVKYTHCKACGSDKVEAKGMCKPCYEKDYRKRRREKQQTLRRNWTTDELEYIAKFCEVDSTSFLAIGLDRSETGVDNKLKELRKNGMLEHYKKSYERKLSYEKPKTLPPREKIKISR